MAHIHAYIHEPSHPNVSVLIRVRGNIVLDAILDFDEQFTQEERSIRAVRLFGEAVKALLESTQHFRRL